MTPAEIQERIDDIKQQVYDGLLRPPEGRRKIAELKRVLQRLLEERQSRDDEAAPKSEFA
jgi:hypothetical protein